MFATLHAGIGVKQTHSYARSLEKERTVLMHSWEALPQAYSEYMKRQCAQNERTITYMPFRV